MNKESTNNQFQCYQLCPKCGWNSFVNEPHTLKYWRSDEKSVTWGVNTWMSNFKCPICKMEFSYADGD